MLVGDEGYGFEDVKEEMLVKEGEEVVKVLYKRIEDICQVYREY